jgi:predicted CopG family antitoxin
MAVCISGSIIVLAKLEALRGPGESYSDVILRLVGR